MDFVFLANPAISPASMWTRKDVAEFKDTIRKEGNEGIIKVGHGETVTVSDFQMQLGTFWLSVADVVSIEKLQKIL